MFTTNSISFKSRNYEIRRADDIARAVSKKFPMVSSSKLSSLPKAELFEDFLSKSNSDFIDYVKEFFENGEGVNESRTKAFNKTVDN